MKRDEGKTNKLISLECYWEHSPCCLWSALPFPIWLGSEKILTLGRKAKMKEKPHILGVDVDLKGETKE